MIDCEEIQNKCNFLPGDYFALPDRTTFVFDGDTEVKEDILNGCRWLPRQDELQGMLFTGKGYNAYPLLEDFAAFWKNKLEYCRAGNFKSMEQLWLAYIMHELHGKQWNGFEWT